MDASWVTAAVALAVAVAGCIGWVLRKAWRGSRRVGHFLDDYNGQPARDGMPAQPGFMARLRSVEELIKKVVAETTPNGGQTMRDTVNRTAKDVAEIKTEQSRVREALADLQRGRTGP